MRIGFVALCLALGGQAINICKEDAPHSLTQSEGKIEGSADSKGDSEFLGPLLMGMMGGGCGGCGCNYGGCGGGCGGCGGGYGGGMMMNPNMHKAMKPPKTPAEHAIAKIGQAEKAAELMKKAAVDEKAAVAPPPPVAPAV